MTRQTQAFGLLAMGLCLAMPTGLHAQSMSYGSTSKADSKGGDAADDAEPGKGAGPKKVKPVSITPYIEAQQVATARLAPGSDFLTYTALAAGVDAQFNGRRTKGAASVRYERRFGYGKVADSDTISGLARVAYALVPNAVNLEAGAMAARSQIQSNGGLALGTPADGSSSSQIYSLFAGPTFKTMLGDVNLAGGYRIGYTKVKNDGGVSLVPGVGVPDIFDESLIQNAEFRAGVKPGVFLPVGMGLGAGYYQEDISNLDQRIRDIHVRFDVTLPISSDVALVGGVGYENVELSARDALRDSSGAPVIGADGRYVTDKSQPRVMAYDTSGLIWDAGVMWRPSKRTALEAHVGRRYGTTSYYGSFAYAPNARSSLNISVYDNIVGFGGQVNAALVGTPTGFEAARNPLNGSLGGCVVSLEAGSCMGGALGSVRSATFRGRGVMLSYGVNLGRLQAGVGMGYDRRKFIAAPGTILASANGVIDQNYWVGAYLNGRVDARSTFGTSVWASRFDSGFGDDGTVLGASASYNRSLTNRLSATAAVGVDGIDRSNLDDIWNASALVGVRYSF